MRKTEPAVHSSEAQALPEQAAGRAAAGTVTEADKPHKDPVPEQALPQEAVSQEPQVWMQVQGRSRERARRCRHHP